MSDDARDTIANGVGEDATETPNSESPAEDASQVQCGPATASNEPAAPADHTGEQPETTAASAETTPTGLLDQLMRLPSMEKSLKTAWLSAMIPSALRETPDLKYL